MDARSQFFSLYEVSSANNKILEEHFLNDNTKIMDLYTRHRMEEEYYRDRLKQNMVYKLYLRIRVYYRLYKEDIDSLNMFYI